MLKNIIKTTFRNISKHKGYSFINIAGLAIGMACCILIIIFIMTEFSFDKFHEKGNRIYRLGMDAVMGERIMYMPVSNNPTALVLKTDYPEVENAVRIRPMGRISIQKDDIQFYEENLFWADNSIFEVFSFPLIKGDPATALKTAFSMVLTESMAQKYFGDEDPIGKPLRFNSRTNFTVQGVVKDIPRNSHFRFDFLCSFETLYSINKQAMEIWLNFNNYAYILLKEGADPDQLQQKFPALIEQYMGRDLKALGGTMKYFLQPLASIHLHSNLEGELPGSGNILYIYIFSAIALFILIIACVNFMNLATARSATRAREVSIRKVVGSHRGELIRQFLGETVMTSVIALVIALGLVYLALPYFSSISGIEMKIRPESMPWLIPTFLGLIVFIGLAAGSYPALYLSAFEPAVVLKGSLKSGRGAKMFRSILVVGQFVISIALIIGTGVILNQIHYMKNKDLGYDMKDVMIVIVRDPKLIQNPEPVKEQLMQIPGILGISSSGVFPGIPSVATSVFRPEGFADNETQIMERYSIDYDFFSTMNIDVASGRGFSPEYPTDKDDAIMINEAALRKFGWKKTDAIGKIIRVPGDMDAEQQIVWVPRTVVGVVKDYHLGPLRNIIRPQIIFYSPGPIFLIKAAHESAAAAFATVKEKWKEIDPSQPIDSFYLDETYSSQYRTEERLGEILASFTGFAIFIACLGLFGMASFTAERRTREIGIRKVMGATVPGVVGLLSKEFLRLVVLANIIAWPVAFFVMNDWLKNFAYRTSITIWMFLITGILSITIALATVSFQSVRAALINPAEAIKNE